MDLPRRHWGWTALAQDLADLTVHRDVDPDEPAHTPLRYRVLIAARDDGMSWADIARIFGLSVPGAHYAYHRWKAHLCCPEHASRSDVA